MLEGAKELVLGAMGSESKSSAFDVEDVLSQLELEEKVALVSGIDFWHTAPVHRLNVPSIRFSDGPNGVRGTRFFEGVPAACLPCGTGLAATWDTDLVKRGGALQGTEAIAKGASVILGPTVNMPRSPLGGRGFESFSEDPYLAGAMGAATIQGIQSKGVAATIKHYVCNDQEHQRQSCDSIVTDRAMREIYLTPFQIAQRDAQPMAYMTSYNKVNGTHASESKKLLQLILREEWAYDGLVMSDWFGTYSTAESIKAGLDLEMPGKTYIRGQLITQALNSRKLLEFELDQCVRRVLQLVKKVLPLGIPENAPEEMVNTKETGELLRKIAADSVVLLKNERNVLPFNKDKTVAVIGPNANYAAYCGGGSASLLPYYAVAPLEGVKAQAKDVKYALGASGWKKLPLLSRIVKTKEGQPGMTMKVFLEPPSTPDRKVVDQLIVSTTEIFLMDYTHPSLESDLYYLDAEGTFTAEETTEYEFSLSVCGTAKLYVDGKMVVDNETEQVRGESFFGTGTREEIGVLQLEEGKTYDVLIRFGTSPTMKSYTAVTMGAGGLRIGAECKFDAAKELAKAVKLAKEVDQVVLCAGLNSDWESEGYDRTHMDLPPHSDDLIAAVCAANPNTAVVVQSGTPITMPWLSSCPALLHAWYGGNETGNAIADVLFGDVNPSGKLPLSFPHKNEDNPAFLNYRTERGRTLYGEDVYVGYRFYEKTNKEVCFPFGHGQSYTQFEMKDLTVKDSGEEITITVAVSNQGPVDGASVVQAYVRQHAPSINRPVKELKGFTKVSVKAGQTTSAKITIPKKYAASFWDEDRDAWIMEKDTYDVLVGDSSANTPLKGEFEVQKTAWWTGV